MRIGPILEVEVRVPVLRAAVAAYSELLGHQVLASGDGWAVLGPAGADWGLIRLREAPGAAPVAPFRTFGWNALEILVADVDRVYERCLAVEGFEVLQSPVSVGAEGTLRAFQAAGPGGEGVYVTQILGPSRSFQLPALDEGENRVYVAVAGVTDVEASLAFLADLGAPSVTDHGLPVRVLNRAYGLPDGTLHRVATAQLSGRCVIEVDEYPRAAVARGRRSCGISAVRVCVDGDPTGRTALDLFDMGDGSFA